VRFASLDTRQWGMALLFQHTFITRAVRLGAGDSTTTTGYSSWPSIGPAGAHLPVGSQQPRCMHNKSHLRRDCPWRRASCDRLYPPTLCSRHIALVFPQSPERSCFDRHMVANCAYTHPIVQTQTQLTRLFAISVLTRGSCYQTYSSILWSMISPVVMYPTALVTPLQRVFGTACSVASPLPLTIKVPAWL
jgi:hypothetical protein